MRKVLFVLGVPATLAAVLLLGAGSVFAQHGGGHGGGGHGGGGHGGGGHGGGSFHGGGAWHGGHGGYGYHHGYGYPFIGVGVGWGYPYGYYGYGYPSYGYYGYDYPVYSENYVQTAPPVDVYGQSYYPPAAMDMALSTAARLDIVVPPGADLWLEGAKMTGQANASVRHFTSPPLDVNREYTYDVRARWTENGQAVERTQSVDVRAGQQSVVNLTQPAKR